MKKVVLITGAGRGIGKQIALNFAKLNYNVIVNYNTSENGAKDVCNLIKEMGGNAIAIKCDISKENEVKDMVKNAIDSFGKIDVLVNNSAYCFDSLFRDKTVENFKRTLDVNVVGTFLVSKYVGQIMYDNKFGRIINISSTNGINTYYPMCVDYDASKAGIISLTHNLAMQFAPYVNCNAVAPGFIATESEISGMDEEFIKLEEEKIFLHRAGTEEDVANVVEFLASDKANYINSEVIRVDGGMYGNY